MKNNAEIIPFLGINDIDFNKKRKDYVQILGVPSVYINELVMPCIVIDRFQDKGLQIYYDMEKDYLPFAIEITKKYGGLLFGKNLFGKSFDEIKSLLNSDFVYKEIFDNIIQIDNPSIWLTFTDKWKLYSVTIFREGYSTYISEKMAGDRPKVSLSGAEREKKYGKYYKFE